MGATTGNQGPSGPGSAMGAGVKGPGNGRNIFVPLVSPHIVAAGVVDLVGGALTVTLQGLTGLAAAYAIALSTDSADVAVTKNVDGDGVLISFTLAGTGTDTINYIVSTVGAA